MYTVQIMYYVYCKLYSLFYAKKIYVFQVEKLFHRIGQEQAGKLDLLVNNAYAGVSTWSSGASL